jgi:aryl-alcohol dehydrogenase-like predicted oxidoreductase
LQYREIGTSGIKASTIAVGAWAMGGWMWGGTNEKESIDAVHAALDRGVDFIDTAPIYGLGLSEKIVGKAIKGRREEVVIATKCSMVCRDDDKGEYKFHAHVQGVDPDGHIPIRIYLGKESIRREVEESLRRLGTDYIDVYQTHWQDSTTPISETMEVLTELKDEGKIRAIGVCNAGVDHITEYLEHGVLDSDQEKYSMLDRDLEKKQAPFCSDHNIAIFAYSPLANGLLTGKMTPDRDFGPGDLRAGNPRFSVENRRRVNEMLGEIEPIAKEHDASIVQLVTAWTLAQPGITHALCGMRNAQQAEENAGAGDIELSSDEVERINSVLAHYSL